MEGDGRYTYRSPPPPPFLSRPISLLFLLSPANPRRRRRHRLAFNLRLVVESAAITSLPSVYSRIPARCRHCYSLLPPLLPLQSLCSRYYRLLPRHALLSSLPFERDAPDRSRTRDNRVSSPIYTRNIFVCYCALCDSEREIKKGIVSLSSLSFFFFFYSIAAYLSNLHCHSLYSGPRHLT